MANKTFKNLKAGDKVYFYPAQKQFSEAVTKRMQAKQKYEFEIVDIYFNHHGKNIANARLTNAEAERLLQENFERLKNEQFVEKPYHPIDLIIKVRHCDPIVNEKIMKYNKSRYKIYKKYGYDESFDKYFFDPTFETFNLLISHTCVNINSINSSEVITDQSCMGLCHPVYIDGINRSSVYNYHKVDGVVKTY